MPDPEPPASDTDADSSTRLRLGHQLLAAGRTTEAERAYSDLIALASPGHPGLFEALLNRGSLRSRSGRHDLAAADFERCLELSPASVPALTNLGHACFHLRRHDVAERAYRQALSLAPSHAGLQLALGRLLVEQGRHADAEPALSASLAVDPGNSDALRLRAEVHLALGQDEAALRCHDALIALLPQRASAHNNRGNALHSLGRSEAAAQAYERALALDPGHARAHYNLANLHVESSRFGEAEAGYRRSLSIEPDFAEAHEALGVLHLLRGNFDAGWPEYEWRWRKAAMRSQWRAFAAPRWTGAEPVEGRTLLLHAEQGLGDTLQFCRYASRVAARKARVVLEVQAPLVALIASSFPDLTVIAPGDLYPSHDLHCPLLSLPLAFRTTIDTVPQSLPYLKAEEEKAAAWRGRIGNHGFRVGIAWQGRRGAIDRGRSLPLSALEPLSRLPGVRLISLQKGDGCEQLGALPAGMAVESLGTDFDAGRDAFVDSAAVIANLDLVVTSDTAIAHLAGALAAPCWVLLKHVPEWRWGLGRDDTPWYPGMRLFRQPTAGDWAAAVEAVAAALRQRAGLGPGLEARSE